MSLEERSVLSHSGWACEKSYQALPQFAIFQGESLGTSSRLVIRDMMSNTLFPIKAVYLYSV